MIGHARIDPPPQGSYVVAMCAICQQRDRKIARYREFMEKVPDTQLSEGLAKLIQEAEAEKAALHRKQQK